MAKAGKEGSAAGVVSVVVVIVLVVVLLVLLVFITNPTLKISITDVSLTLRPVDLVGRVRTDRRCGKEFPLPDGSASECDGNSANHCCSKWGYCGPGADHCDCVGCVDFRSVDPKGKHAKKSLIPKDCFIIFFLFRKTFGRWQSESR